ncbi:transketolase family protein [Proteocatella sphenisci]|uniref:transketolase family protein n=1 Tax=Proteocatella sphenisci TaxID=181070 RepID=UPI0004904EBD|nr:transketolase family protein [Proteocatella sphenisci]
MKRATREAYGIALAEIAKNNDKIVVLDADLSKSTKSADFKKEYPERFFNAGIAEANMIGMAAGMAATGLIPFASTFAMFAAGRAFEQIRNSVAYPKMNVKIVGSHSGITVGEDGATHQAIEDISLMRSIPNMVVINPCDATETAAAVKAAAEYNGPVYIRTGRMAVEDLHEKGCNFEIGKGEVLKSGDTMAIVATGICVKMALDAAEELSEKGINARVINISTIKPLDEELILKAARECGKIITVEEHSIIGGLGSAVSEAVCEGFPVIVRKIGVRDVFGQSGKPEELLKCYGITKENIVAEALLISAV